MIRSLRRSLQSSTRPAPLSFRAIKDLAISHCNGRSEKPGSAFSGRTLCQLAPQNDDYQTEKNVARTVDDPRARRRLTDARGAKAACGSTHNAHVVCEIHLQRPGSRQLARPCRSKMRGVSAVLPARAPITSKNPSRVPGTIINILPAPRGIFTRDAARSEMTFLPCRRTTLTQLIPLRALHSRAPTFSFVLSPHQVSGKPYRRVYASTRRAV